jgi:glycosyltransferase involved in cell wall biosynthesis
MGADGWEVHLVSGDAATGNDATSHQTNFHVIPMKRNPSPLADCIAIYHWWRLLGKIRPTVIAVGTPKAALLGLVAGAARNVPVRVYVLRGLRLEGSRKLTWAVLYLLEKITSLNATQVVAVSQSLKKVYLRLRLSGPGKILVIGSGSSHGVNTKKFVPQIRPQGSIELNHLKLAKLQGRPILAFVGRFSADKGASTLLVCRKYLRDNGIDHEFVIMGASEGEIDTLAALDQYGRKVTLLGHVKEPSRLYGFFDLLLLPSKREGFPNVILEASACGVAVVTSDATGCVDAVVNNKTGLITPLGDDLAFAKATRALIEDPALRKRLGAEGARWVRNGYDEEEVAKLHAAFYLNLLQKNDPN